MPLRPKDSIESMESKKVSGLFYYTNILLKSLNAIFKSLCFLRTTKQIALPLLEKMLLKPRKIPKIRL
ncbi:hypothetical protein DCO58_00740 [Helicobacter saguini]|uniref:Uncharacterized protein n=1 Tax=Helicobacter saguini TaxID=1548018 RepID=A0A347VR09_9HELI|nr:hypothetical protein [Helicobacter saguini]MWV63083.1 hypothetical protein [Helicobacter saguini]MWV66247.1 hypothetical protein [Helicobacter saguini]MWV68600.1 hypothetical protein [Helicobacter saguini]MWV71849.1 hypothetical protein [Helicobacter saguini]TLD95868.1 hypothetical protein LS64_000430 [Helicobacter saguini]